MQKYKQFYRRKYYFLAALQNDLLKKTTKFLSFINQLCKYFARAFLLGVGEANKKV